MLYCTVVLGWVNSATSRTRGDSKIVVAPSWHIDPSLVTPLRDEKDQTHMRTVLALNPYCIE